MIIIGVILLAIIAFAVAPDLMGALAGLALLLAGGALAIFMALLVYIFVFA